MRPEFPTTTYITTTITTSNSNAQLIQKATNGHDINVTIEQVLNPTTVQTMQVSIKIDGNQNKTQLILHPTSGQDRNVTTEIDKKQNNAQLILNLPNGQEINITTEIDKKQNNTQLILNPRNAQEINSQISQILLLILIIFILIVLSVCCFLHRSPANTCAMNIQVQATEILQSKLFIEFLA